MTETNENNDSSYPRSRVKKQSNGVLYLFIVTILALTGGFFFYQKNLSSIQQDSQNLEISSTETNPVEQELVSPDTQLTQNSKFQDDTSLTSKNVAVFDNVTLGSDKESDVVQSQPPATEEIAQESISAESQELKENDGEINYDKLVKQLDDFYAHLDSQPYMQAFKLPEPSREHFTELIQKLIDNPPVVTRETDDLFTLLKNTAHFFRIIGKDNILVLKGILDREKESFESILNALYHLTAKPQYLENAYSLKIDQNALYDYAGFFLNTMGGRLYLFRRDSNSRMAVSFYAIMIVDRTNQAGNSHHGIDIRPAIDSLIEEIENGGKNLQQREHYLDTLYDLKEKYG